MKRKKVKRREREDKIKNMERHGRGKREVRVRGGGEEDVRTGEEEENEEDDRDDEKIELAKRGKEENKEGGSTVTYHQHKVGGFRSCIKRIRLY